eukprot:scaffold151220_cov56-Attheya_sp.AAC.2
MDRAPAVAVAVAVVRGDRANEAFAARPDVVNASTSHWLPNTASTSTPSMLIFVAAILRGL